ncbi:MAG: MFS transporter [Promethearchaeota archaeon]
MEKKYSFLVIVILTFYTLSLTSIMGPMTAEIAEALNLESEAQVGFVSTLFLIIGASCSIIWAILGDRYSRKKLLIIGTFDWVIFTFLTAFSTDFQMLLTFQSLAAIGFGAALPLSFSLSLDLVDPEKRGKAFGMLSAANVIGIGIGMILSGLLIDDYPWYLSFVLIAISGMACVIFLIFIDEPIKGDKDTLYKNVDADVLGLSIKIRRQDLKEIWRIKTNLLIITFNFVMFIALGATTYYFISMLKTDKQLSSSVATYILIIIYISQLFSGPIFGNLGDKQYEKNKNGRLKLVLICITCGSILYIFAYSLIFTIADTFLLIIFIIILFVGAFFFGGIDPLTQVTLGEINPPQIRATIFSINYLAYTYGRSVSIFLLGFFFVIFGNVYQPGYIIASFILLGCSLFLVPIMRTLPKDLKMIKENQLKTSINK